MFEPLNAEDPEAGKGTLLLAYFLQSILLPLSSCGQRFFYDGFVEAKKKKNSKKCHRVHLYCIVFRTPKKYQKYWILFLRPHKKKISPKSRCTREEIATAASRGALLSFDLGPVHTYPDIFESETFSFRIRLSSTRIRRIRKRIRKFLNLHSRVEIFESDNISDTCGRSNPDIF